MAALKGVLDAMMVIGLAKGGIFDRLASLYSPLYLPISVKREVITGQGFAGERELMSAIGVWITEVTPASQLLQQFSAILSVADREVLAGALSEGVDHILSDDAGVRREAGRFGLTCLRTTDVVVFLKRQGIVPDVTSLLDRIRQQGFGIDNTLYEQTLRVAGEWPPKQP